MSCQAIRSNGKPCSVKANKLYGSIYCGFHKDQYIEPIPAPPKRRLITIKRKKGSPKITLPTVFDRLDNDKIAEANAYFNKYYISSPCSMTLAMWTKFQPLYHTKCYLFDYMENHHNVNLLIKRFNESKYDTDETRVLCYWRMIAQMLVFYCDYSDVLHFMNHAQMKV
jgi:hypothetical protein